MIARNNPLLAGATGKLQNLVIRQYGDKTVLSAVPDMSRRKLFAKQKAANELMREAIYAARHITANPRQKQRACELLQSPPNKVFREIVRQYLLGNGQVIIFEETPQEKEDRLALHSLKEIITNEHPGAQIILFGQRATPADGAGSDWDLLILTPTDQPPAMKWELQEKLLGVTIHQGTKVNILMVEKSKWQTAPEYEALRKRVEQGFTLVE